MIEEREDKRDEKKNYNEHDDCSVIACNAYSKYLLCSLIQTVLADLTNGLLWLGENDII